MGWLDDFADAWNDGEDVSASDFDPNFDVESIDYQPETIDWMSGGNEFYSPYGGSAYDSSGIESGEGVDWMSSGNQYYSPYGGAAYGSSDSTGSGSGLGGLVSGLGSAGSSLLGGASNLLSGNAGSIISSLLGAGLGAYGAKEQNKQIDKQNKMTQAEWDKQNEIFNKRREASLQYDAPKVFTQQKTAVENPYAYANPSKWVTDAMGVGRYDMPPTKSATFFTNNQLPTFAEGGLVPDQPSVLGFIKYLIKGKKLPSEVLAQQKAEREGAIQRATDRLNRRIDEASGLYSEDEENEENDEKVKPLAKGGLTQYLQGTNKGQSDKIPVLASPGEYYFDADTVSSLGDGNNKAGAIALDKMRENIRKHKRSAPASKIPPKAKSPMAYLKGAK